MYLAVVLDLLERSDVNEKVSGTCYGGWDDF